MISDSQKPDWWEWELNGVKFQTLKSVFDNGQTPVDFTITPTSCVQMSTVKSFRDEMANTAIDIINRAGKKIILLAISGIDSEALARLIVDLNGRLELVYIKKSFKDTTEIEILQKISQELHVKLHILVFYWSTHGRFVKQSILETCTQATMMNNMLWAFKQFDNSEYFYVTGNGAFRKRGNRFTTIHEKYGINTLSKLNGRMIPLDLRDICMRAMASQFQLDGEFYAHISNISEVAALFKHPLMKVYSNGEVDDKDVYFSEFPDCLFKEKTNPYVGTINHAARQLKLTNLLLLSKYPQYRQIDTRHIAGFLNIDKIFI